MTDMERAVRRYLEYVMGDQGLSATALAKKAGIATSTLTRFLNDKSYSFKLSSTTIEKIAQATKQSPAPFFDGSDIVDLTQHSFGIKDGQANSSHTTSVAIADIEAGVWREKVPPRWDGTIHYASAENYRGPETFITRFRGDAIEGVVSDREWLFCVKTADFGGRHSPLEWIVVLQTTRDNDLVELTLGVARWREGAIRVKPLQKGAQAKDLLIDDRDVDGPVRIVGYVLYVFRYPELRTPEYPHSSPYVGDA